MGIELHAVQLLAAHRSAARRFRRGRFWHSGHNPVVTVGVDVRNTGSVAGTEVVQLYIRNTAASVEQPVRELKGFARVTLAPGEQKHVEFPLGFDELNFYNVDIKRTVEPTTYKIWVGGSSLATAETSLQVDCGRTWKMIFPNPGRNTVEHQIGDHSDYSLTTSDPAYPGGDISVIAVAPQSDAKNGHGSAEHLYLSFERRGQPTVIVASADGGINWSRLTTLPQRVLLLKPQDSGVIAVSGPAAWRIAADGTTTELGSIATNI
jgi:hypothetical protein